ncbi:DNA primase [Lysinibacillus capsici]|uniref:DNA primase n=1 Tax=Lysinibacillus capsici TaxID=2115968 RepID=UPI00247FD62E|nr:DNA primase [Lysinibacillus capsici]
MAKISQESIERVKAVTLVDLAQTLGLQTKRVGKQLFIPCPNPSHNESKLDTCCIEINRNIFNCFHCADVRGNNAISLYSWHQFGQREGKFKESVLGVAELMGIEVKDELGAIIKPGSNTYKPSVKFISQELEPQPIQVVDAFYRALLQLCPLREEHVNELMKKRRYSAEEINLYMFRSVPSLEEWVNIYAHLKSLNYSFERIPGLSQIFQPDFFDSKIPRELGDVGTFTDSKGKKHNGYWFYVLNVSKGYFIPVFNEDGFIVRLRVRRDGENPKYVWFSSTHNIEIENTITKARRNGVSSGAPITIEIPPDYLKRWQRGINVTNVFQTRTLLITEGEHKAKISAKSFNVFAAGLPGAGNFNEILQLIPKWNIQKLIIAYDMDTLQRSDNSSESLKKQATLMEIVNRFAIEVSKLGVQSVIWTWNLKDGKGLDDLVYNHKLPIEYNLITKRQRAVTLDTVHSL